MSTKTVDVKEWLAYSMLWDGCSNGGALCLHGIRALTHLTWYIATIFDAFYMLTKYVDIHAWLPYGILHHAFEGPVGGISCLVNDYLYIDEISWIIATII